MKNTISIKYKDICEEVIKRQKKFGKGDPDICCNKIFNGVSFKYMIVLINNWPYCENCEDYAEMIIEYEEEEEIPFALYCTACNMTEKE